MVKLNDDKTELIVFTSKYKQDLYNDLSIAISDTCILQDPSRLLCGRDAR